MVKKEFLSMRGTLAIHMCEAFAHKVMNGVRLHSLTPSVLAVLKRSAVSANIISTDIVHVSAVASHLPRTDEATGIRVCQSSSPYLREYPLMPPDGRDA